MTIKPTEDWVVLERHEYKHKTLYVHGQETHRGTVVAVGPGKWIRRFVEVEDPLTGKRFKTRQGEHTGRRKPMDVKIGDVVEYSDAGWEERIIDGKPYVFTRQDSIFCFSDSKDGEGFQAHAGAIIK